jgi:hypothetical protein
VFPGAGKTPVDLNLATQRRDAARPTHAVFLSGNGPLVHVLATPIPVQCHSVRALYLHNAPMETTPNPPPELSSRAWYGASIADFLRADPDSIVGRLTTNSDFPVLLAQRDAWLEPLGRPTQSFCPATAPWPAC